MFFLLSPSVNHRSFSSPSLLLLLPLTLHSFFRLSFLRLFSPLNFSLLFTFSPFLLPPLPLFLSFMSFRLRSSSFPTLLLLISPLQTLLSQLFPHPFLCSCLFFFALTLISPSFLYFLPCPPCYPSSHRLLFPPQPHPCFTLHSPFRFLVHLSSSSERGKKDQFVIISLQGGQIFCCKRPPRFSHRFLFPLFLHSGPWSERRRQDEHQKLPGLHQRLPAAHRPDEIPPPRPTRLHRGSLHGKILSSDLFQLLDYALQCFRISYHVVHDDR